MEYTICFEIFDKKMKTTIEANSKEEAEYLLRGKIKICKVEERFDDIDVLNFFKKHSG